jgi:DNA-binding PadR family transcriptional regulator
VYRQITTDPRRISDREDTDMGNGWGSAWASTDWQRHHGRRQGPPPWVMELVRNFGGPDLGSQRGPKVRRGDVRLAILDVLSVVPVSLKKNIQQVSERTDGAWKPSPGSVYPTIQQLEDEGLIEGHDADGRRLLGLTDAGERYVAEHAEELGATWEVFERPERDRSSYRGPDLKPILGQVMGAVWQIMVNGTEQQRAEAAEVLGETRRRLYGLLADGDPE